MKKILLFSLVCFPFILAAQNTPERKQATSDDSAKIDQLVTIQEAVRQLDRRTDFRIQTLLNEEFMQEVTDGGGQLTGYLSDGEVQKVETKVFLSNGQAQVVYYYKENQLIFVREKEFQYSYDADAGTFNYNEIEVLYEGTFSFQNGILLFEETIGARTYTKATNPEDYHTNRATKYQRLLEDK